MNGKKKSFGGLSSWEGLQRDLCRSQRKVKYGSINHDKIVVSKVDNTWQRKSMDPRDGFLGGVMVFIVFPVNTCSNYNPGKGPQSLHSPLSV